MTLIPHPTALDWLTKDWRAVVPFPYAEPALTLVAVLCGAMVGEERQKSEKPAGLRTLILVCLGAAAFTLISFAFGSPGEAGRVAAQIVTGIGFLGAGVILHTRGGVSGTTTAATIWVTAAIGMVIGNGFAGAAICLATLVRFVVGTIAFYEYRVAGELERRLYEIDFIPAGGKARVRLERALVDVRSESIRAHWSDIEGGLERLTLKLVLQRRSLCELLDGIANVEEVKSIREIRNSVSNR